MKRNKMLEKGLEILGESFFQPKNYQAQGYADLSGRSSDEVRGLAMSVKFN